MEMEEFEDRSESPAEAVSSAASVVRPSKRNSVSKEGDLRSKEDSKRVKVHESGKERGPSDEPAGGLRRSRRWSSQAQADEGVQSSQRSDGTAAAPKVDESAEGDDDDLALELERELERELEVEMRDASEPEEASAASTQATKMKTNRSLSPVSRLKRGERAMKISTPKAHTPDLDDAPAYQPSSLSKSFHRSTSPVTHRSTSASIGLGLQQTGVGITPTASPHLDIASPVESSFKSPLAVEQDDDQEEEEEDDDLQDFAAELDMSLAEGPEPVPAAAAPAVVEKRRSSRAHTAADARPRQVRKAYGLGGPRQEEEELEDSD